MNIQFSIQRDNSSARRLSQLQNSCRDALRAMATSTKNSLGWNRNAFLYLPCYRYVISNMNIFLVLGRSSLLVSSVLSLGRSRHQMFFHCRWVYRIWCRNLQRESSISELSSRALGGWINENQSLRHKIQAWSPAFQKSFKYLFL